MSRKLTHTTLILLIAFVFLFGGCSLSDSLSNNPIKRNNSTDTKTLFNTTTSSSLVTSSSKLKTKETEKTNTSRTVKLKAVGDILLHDTVYRDARTTSSYDFNPMLQPIRDKINSADIAFANQESPIGGQALGLSSYPRFNSPYQIADTLKRVGFDVINLANNHTLDQGEKGVLNSIDYLDKSGLSYIGAATSSKQANKITIIEKKGIKLAFLGYTFSTNGLPVPQDKPYLVNLINTDRIKSDIERAEQIADFTIVSLHFGTQYRKYPDLRQKSLAKQVANSGADIVLGHHPHVLQPVRWLKSSSENNNRTLVAYSLGNFLSGQNGIERNIGGIISIDITQSDQKTKITQVNFTPTWVESQDKTNFRVVPLKSASNITLDNPSKWYQSTMDRVLGNLSS